ncbi:PLC-like phosphodiesterase [Colletotrichum lupini]|nr:PLC-like phosphodiesterase [Colletotrichum lupini]
MAVGLPTSAKNPVQNRLQVLQAQYPEYHVVIWASAGGSFKLLPGTRWVRKGVELIQFSNLLGLSTDTRHFEYYIIIEGAFRYRNKYMKATDYRDYVGSTANFDFEKRQCVMQPKTDFCAKSWMKHLPDDTCVKDLSLPGTRCSSASTYWINDVANIDVEPEISDKKLRLQLLGMHKCHKDSIRTQLQNGVRLLDLRCDGERRLRHGPLVLEKQLEDVLDDVRDFLKDNKNETVMIMLSFSSASATYDADKHWSEGYSINYDDLPKNFNRDFKRDMKKENLLYTGKQWPLLRDVRGKAVIFRGWDVDSEEDRWGLECRLPVWVAARSPTSSIKAEDLAAQRWESLAGDFSSRDSLKSIVLAACLHHDPTDETGWVSPLQTAPILQNKAVEHLKNSTRKMKHLWVYGDDMKEKTNLAIAKLNFWGSDDEGPSRPLPLTVHSAPSKLITTK